MSIKKSLLSLFSLGIVTAAHAQVYVTTEQSLPNLTSVTNEGVAVGYEDQNCPFYLWDAVADTYTEIGGISAGSGVGGVPRFSDSGLLIAAPMESNHIKINTTWTSSNYPDFSPYQFTQFAYLSDWNLFAVGHTPDMKEGIIIKSANNGVSWVRADDLSRQKEDGTWENYKPDFGILCIGVVNTGQVLVGGSDGRLLTGRGNGYWESASLGVETESPVKTYYSISFRYEADQWGSLYAVDGCIGTEMEDGSYAVFYTNDGAQTFDASEGVAGVPVSIANAGSRFLLVTPEGIIQKSDDLGKTWHTVYTETEGRAFHRLVFGDENKGLALCDNVVYVTRDGGETWTLADVLPSENTSVVWNDAVWYGDTLTLVGTDGCWQSTDDGMTFSNLSSVDGVLGAIYYDSREVYNILGDDGETYRKALTEDIQGYTAGLYSVETEEWIPLASAGYVSGVTASSPWQISGDGEHVVGIAQGFDNTANVVVAYAAIWDGTENVTLLGNKFANIGRACRANAVSYDGSVVAGWQDIFGPWYGSVWKKGADGSYSQRMLISNDSVSENDLNYDDKSDCMDNLVGACQSVSSDGKYIGGQGTAATTSIHGAWIWNEETGFEVLTDDDATVADLSNDGSKAIGWCYTGTNAWIWSREEGFNYLQNYLENNLGYDLGGLSIVSVYDMSPNGRYLCGFGFVEGNEYPVGYVVDLFKNSNVEERMQQQIKAAVYPNPVAEELHVDLPFNSKDVSSTINLIDMQGRVVRTIDSPSESNIINVRGLSVGLYILDVATPISHKTFKVIIK